MVVLSNALELSRLLDAICNFLSSHIDASWVVTLIEYILIGVGFLSLYAVLALILIYMERRVCAFFQCRLGPNRVGPQGIFQLFADMIKILLKEIIPVNNTDKLLFFLAPLISILGSFLTFGGLHFAQGVHGVDFNIGIFYILAVSSISIVGVLLAGWSSNNKYALIGSMRSGAQVVSYELSASLCLMATVVISGTMSMSGIIDSQADWWNVFKAPTAFVALIIYLIAGHAETNRGPFDLPEAESELTAGYHTEYSGIMYGLFYLGEYLNMFIIAGVATICFLGGWQPLHLDWEWAEGFNGVMAMIPSWIWFFAKAFSLIFLSLWVRWSFPRLRIDQLLKLEWKVLMPFSIANLILVAVWVACTQNI